MSTQTTAAAMAINEAVRFQRETLASFGPDYAKFAKMAGGVTLANNLMQIRSVADMTPPSLAETFANLSMFTATHKASLAQSFMAARTVLGADYLRLGSLNSFENIRGAALAAGMISTAGDLWTQMATIESAAEGDEVELDDDLRERMVVVQEWLLASTMRVLELARSATRGAAGVNEAAETWINFAKLLLLILLVIEGKQRL